MKTKNISLLSGLPFLFLSLFLSGFLNLSAEIESFENIKKGVVQIRVYTQNYDAFSPWASKSVSASSGTGFLIDGERILTNAHVISNSRYIQIQRHNQTTWYEVDILHIAHDCDLAILKAKDPEFYKDAHFFELGDIPELNSPINVVGYPIGGSRISVSRGIVSRKQQSTYAHSQVDSHLVIQVDAAINPGNSGGPAIQDNKVVGVAFQVATRGENIGYLIPTTVIRYFLKDIEDGKYDGYVELGIRFMNSFSTALRKLLKVPDELGGVFVQKVLRGGSAFGYLEKDDLIFEIDGLPIGRNGTVVYDKEDRLDFVEIIDNKHAGEVIHLKVFRKGKIEAIEFPAKIMNNFAYLRNKYDEPFDYFMIGGLLFQNVSRDILQAWINNKETYGGSQFLYRFYYFIEDDLGSDEVSEDIIFYRKLNHRINSTSGSYLNLILEKFNGTPVKNLRHLKQLASSDTSEFLQLKFRDVESPLIFKKNEIQKADDEIRKIYKLEKAND